MNKFEQRGLALEHNDVVGQIEKTRTATHVIDQSGEDAAASAATTLMGVTSCAEEG